MDGDSRTGCFRPLGQEGRLPGCPHLPFSSFALCKSDTGLPRSRGALAAGGRGGKNEPRLASVPKLLCIPSAPGWARRASSPVTLALHCPCVPTPSSPGTNRTNPFPSEDPDSSYSCPEAPSSCFFSPTCPSSARREDVPSLGSLPTGLLFLFKRLTFCSSWILCFHSDFKIYCFTISVGLPTDGFCIPLNLVPKQRRVLHFSYPSPGPPESGSGGLSQALGLWGCGMGGTSCTVLPAFPFRL